MLKKGDSIAIVACSNAKQKQDNKITLLKEALEKMGLKPIKSKYLTTKNTEKNIAYYKAKELEKFYKTKKIKAIFDISGGDYANSILPYLDFKKLKNNYTPFFGYSDLTTIINALYTKNKQINYLYQILNITNSKKQLTDFYKSFFEKQNNIFKISYFSNTNISISGIVIGGNIRCLLKLAGTKYMPNPNNKILFLESLSGDIARIETYLEQLKQIEYFKNPKAILLGTFTQLQQTHSPQEIVKIVEKYVPKNIPIIKTEQIGHSKNSKCLKIGSVITINFINKSAI